MARISLTAAARRRASKGRIVAALRHAGMPLEIVERDGVVRVYFIGTDDRGIELELILTPEDDDDRWVVIHAMPTGFRKNW
ncbi:hypothetical protein [Gordonia soli]|uniref:DUF4258 domain-containing protein n=1 Tax=Gordonia soli NBRC 108243 TaxID=1223545 RepID=M0QRP6_9ACTN|nr:hypothetical protein [Gordonia soli]GAC71051.1 hypothetical protein GS4_47_00410 [Gordonia soli NBRC 108243]